MSTETLAADGSRIIEQTLGIDDFILVHTAEQCVDPRHDDGVDRWEVFMQRSPCPFQPRPGRPGHGRDNGAGEREQEQILAEALPEHYFKDNGHRAAGLSAEFTDIAWATIEPH